MSMTQESFQSREKPPGRKSEQSSQQVETSWESLLPTSPHPSQARGLLGPSKLQWGEAWVDLWWTRTEEWTQLPSLPWLEPVRAWCRGMN